MRPGNRAGGWRRWMIGVCIGIFMLAMGSGPGPLPARAFDDENLVNALDISHWSGTITDAEAACWVGSGFSHVIAGTQNSAITVQQLQTAVKQGMTVDAYVMLYWDYDIGGQVRDTLAMIANFPIGRLWLDAEQPSGGRTAAQLIDKVQQGWAPAGPCPAGFTPAKPGGAITWPIRTLFRTCRSGKPTMTITAILTTGMIPGTGMKGPLAAGRIPPASSMTRIGPRRICAGSMSITTSWWSTASRSREPTRARWARSPSISPMPTRGIRSIWSTATQMRW